MTDEICYLDLETSTHSDKGSVCFDGDWSVYAGWSVGGVYRYAGPQTKEDPATARLSWAILDALNSTTDSITLVGHNIAFDIKFMLWECPGLLPPIYSGRLKIWDTMLAEYLLTGQELSMAKLDELITIYESGELKDSNIKEYWKKGVSTEDIPEEEIVPYLENDVRSLQGIYEGQIALMEEQDQTTLILSQMDARLCTTLMEYYGMAFDKELAVKQMNALTEMEDELISKMQGLMYECITLNKHNSGVFLEHLTPKHLNPASAAHLSHCLFGTAMSYEYVGDVVGVDGEVVKYKSGIRAGQVKTKKYKVESSDVSFGLEPHSLATYSNKTNRWSVDDDHLSRLLKGPCPDHYQRLIEAVLEHRALSKNLHTYFAGYSDQVCSETNHIHAQFNHSITATGRLSSSKPNLQNLSHKGIED